MVPLGNVVGDGGNERVLFQVRRESDLGVDAGQVDRIPDGGGGFAKGAGSFVVPVVIEGVHEKANRAVALEDDGVVVLHKEAAPGEVCRTANGGFEGGALDDDGLVVLEAAHVLALDISGTGGGDQALLRHVLGGGGFAVIVAVVDDHFEARAEMLEPGNDVGFVQIVGDDADLGQGIGDGLIEEVENSLARFEAHPVKGIGGLGWVGMKVRPWSAFGGSRAASA